MEREGRLNTEVTFTLRKQPFRVLILPLEKYTKRFQRTCHFYSLVSAHSKEAIEKMDFRLQYHEEKNKSNGKAGQRERKTDEENVES